MLESDYDLAQAALAELGQAVDALLQELMAELHYNLRQLAPASILRIASTYGAEFHYAPGESEDEGLPEATLSPAEGEPALPAATG